MRQINLGSSNLKVPVIGIGCMRMGGLDIKEAARYIDTCMELGLNFFDHADIYGGGECEKIFAEAINMNPEVREKVIIQSKCGIRPDIGMYDFSKEYILNSVDNILKRLNTEYLDVLLLHRPDALVEPEEVAETFDILERSGKVNNFGVSNHKPAQIELLKKYVKQDIIVDQLQTSITNATMISNGINVNTGDDAALDRDDSVLDYCRLNDITIQNWSPFQYGCFEGPFLGNDKFKTLNEKVNELADKYGITDSAMAVAWLLRHPAHMQPIVGTMNIKRIKDISKAADVELSREDWYGIFKAAGNRLP
ncbi:MAG: aldo/keto reductase [Lachnospiraceae bacterium]|nr:aldo/keto reductase [Lachnospiraceae bacterium]